MIKPSIPKGTRDFGPEVVRKRQHILQTIRRVFENYGFQPLETPAMENLSTLTGKYGEEGDKLMFRVLDNGDILPRAQQARDSRELANLLCEKALRYDLTIPFARYVALHRNELALPFRRYQIQPVWRADRPQKGRYREFLQCDADIVGSGSLLHETELLGIYDTVFSRLGLKGYALHVNNRKILAGLAETLGRPEALTDITVAIDKLDKISLEGVQRELGQRGLDADAVERITAFLALRRGSNAERLQGLDALLQGSALGLQGLQEIRAVLDAGLRAYREPPLLDPALARGLNYYTGIIIEAKAPPQVQIGSIGGGGRYDDLTGLFGLQGISGVGISFGVDRIYDVLEELGLFPSLVQQSTRLLFLQTDAADLPGIFPLLDALRSRDIPSEVYPEPLKLDKQLKYADRRQIPLVAIFGESERGEGVVSVKNMRTGQQEKIPADEEALARYVLDAGS